MLMEAQHDERPQQVVFGMKVLTCNYGECLKSNVTWARRWGWTESKVRRFLKLLENMGQLRTKNEGITTRISLINYATYDPRRRECNEEAPRKRRGSAEEATTDKNVKNVKNEKNKHIRAPKKPKPKKFIPPSLEDVKSYFKENGYSEESAETFHKYYSNGEPPWHDGQGKPVKSWKQKAVAVWFKPENKNGNQQRKVGNGTHRYKSRVDRNDAALAEARAKLGITQWGSDEAGHDHGSFDVDGEITETRLIE
jgi:hypothetical protein